MSDSNNKRNQFRQQIRRRQLENIFQGQLNRLLFEQNTSFNQIDPQKSNQYEFRIEQLLKIIPTSIKNNNYEQIFLILTYFSNEAFKHPETMSFCINAKMDEIGEELIDSFKNDIPITVLGELSDEQEDEGDQNTMNEQMFLTNKTEIVRQLLKIGNLLELQKYTLKSIIILLKMLWNVTSNKHYLRIPQILKLWLQILKKVLQSSHHELIKKHLKQLGFYNELDRIIDMNDFPIEIHQLLLSVIQLFLSENQNDNDLVEGIVVLGNDIQYRNKYAVYCMFLIKNNVVVLPALNLLDQIFNNYGYMVDYLDCKLFEKVLILMLDPNREINLAALALMNTCVYYSQIICQDLMYFDCTLLDCVYRRLQMCKTSEQNERITIDRCVNIVCDLLLTTHKKTKQIIYQHPIWEFILENIYENSPFLSAVIVFKYFFPCFGRTKTLNVLPHLLDVFANLPLNLTHLQVSKEVKVVLTMLVDEAAEFWNEEDYERVIQMMEERKLLEFIEE